MSVFTKLRRLVEDPPPAFAFEISQAGIAWAQRGSQPGFGFAPLDADVLSVTPLRDNVVRPDALFASVRALAPKNGKGRGRTAALILPDYSTRVAVLDFDSFPADKDEQASLVRFRIKKSIPFEVESARVSYFVQSSGGGKRYEVVAAVAALEIVARYEAAFRSAGLQPGYVTTSTLAALHLASGEGIRVVAKLNGKVLTVCVLEDQRLKLVRCVELPERTEHEVMSVLYPTLAYVEDRMQAAPRALWTCGFGELSQPLAERCVQELGLTVAPLRSRLGPLDANNAGLLGYLEASGGAA